mgnify:FL=1
MGISKDFILLAGHAPAVKRVRSAAAKLRQAEWDRRAFLKDAHNQGLAEGHKQGLEEGRKEGLEQGRALGEAKGRADVVRQLAASGLLTLEQVAEATGMSADEVKALTSE